MPKGKQKGSPLSVREHDVARAIFVLRRAQGLDQSELAERALLATDTISRIERTRSSPSLSTLFRVADGLGLSLVTVLLGAEIIGGESTTRLLQAVAGLRPSAVEDAIARLSRTRGLRGVDD